MTIRFRLLAATLPLGLIIVLTAFADPVAPAADPKTGWWPPFVPNVAVPGLALPTPAGMERLTIESAECSGISGFRADWDRPIPLAADGAMKTRMDETAGFGGGPVADWNDPTAPGAIACDAVHRSLLVRFPGAVEQIAQALGAGKTIVQAELLLPYRGSEVFPPPQYENPAGLSFLGQQWATKEPQWHAVAWALKHPWMTDRELGPTYNAFINGAGYWAAFGASDTAHDRVTTSFGPTPLTRTTPEGRMDITASFLDPAFGADLGARLRRLADCGFLVRKWEVYDASFWTGGYEWGTATGPRALLLGAPKLVLYLKTDAQAKAPVLPPAADVRALAGELAGGKGGKPTAVLPNQAEIENWMLRFGHRTPDWMNEAAWKRTQQLWTLEKNSGSHGFPTSVEAYGRWLDNLLAKSPRRWSGFDAPELGITPLRYRETLPLPVLDHLRLYWWAWLLPDRDFEKGFDYNGQHYGWVQGYIGAQAAAEYYAKTHDWRGDFSVYRTYCRAMGTMNFNHWASAGTLFGGALLESPRLLDEGRIGLAQWPLKTWCWFDGSTQESIDHYYLTLSLASQKAFADFGPTVEDKLMGQAILAKSTGEIASCLHPRLKRFTSSSGRSGIAYILAIQDGLNHVLHTLMPEGALTDIGRDTVGDGGVPVVGHDFAPGLVATLTLDGPWAPTWYGPAFAEKPVPYQMTASYKVWGSFSQTPLWKRSFQALHYGVASLDLAKGECVPFLINWRRDDKPVETAEQLGALIGRFGVNYTELLDSLFHESDTHGAVLKNSRNPNGVVGSQGGPTYSLQHRNRLIVLGSPEKGLPYPDRVAPKAITSIQTTLGLLALKSPALELLVDGKPANAPLKLKAGQRIVIRDGVTLIGILPLPGTDLGRTTEVEITVGGNPTDMQGGGTMAETLRINAYNYQGPPLPKEQWSSDRIDDAWSGFCLQGADTSEFKDAASFDAHLAKGKIDSTWDAATRQLHLRWALGDDTMDCVFSPSAPIAQPTTTVFPTRTVNGKWLYLAPGLERECDLSMMGRSGRLEKNGAIFLGEPGHMGSLLTDPIHGIYEAWNPFPSPSALGLTLPNGAAVEALGKVGITRITVFAKENRVTIDGAVPAPDRATVAALSGFARDVNVQLNDQTVKTATGQLNGQPVIFVSLDGKPLQETTLLIKALLEQRTAMETHL